MPTGVIIPPDFAIATLIWATNTGKQVTVTCGVDNTAASSNASVIAADWLAGFQLAGNPGAAAQMTTFWTSIGCYVLARSVSGILGSATASNTVIGTIASSALDQPLFAPLVVSKPTANAGRKYRGRMYPPLTRASEAVVDAYGNITPAELINLRAAWNGFFLNRFTSSFKPALLHTDPTVAPTPHTAFFVRPVVGIQRRRRVRGA